MGSRSLHLIGFKRHHRVGSRLQLVGGELPRFLAAHIATCIFFQTRRRSVAVGHFASGIVRAREYHHPRLPGEQVVGSCCAGSGNSHVAPTCKRDREAARICIIGGFGRRISRRTARYLKLEIFRNTLCVRQGIGKHRHATLHHVVAGERAIFGHSTCGQFRLAVEQPEGKRIPVGNARIHGVTLRVGSARIKAHGYGVGTLNGDGRERRNVDDAHIPVAGHVGSKAQKGFIVIARHRHRQLDIGAGQKLVVGKRVVFV